MDIPVLIAQQGRELGDKQTTAKKHGPFQYILSTDLGNEQSLTLRVDRMCCKGWPQQEPSTTIESLKKRISRELRSFSVLRSGTQCCVGQESAYRQLKKGPEQLVYVLTVLTVVCVLTRTVGTVYTLHSNSTTRTFSQYAASKEPTHTESYTNNLGASIGHLVLHALVLCDGRERVSNDLQRTRLFGCRIV